MPMVRISKKNISRPKANSTPPVERKPWHDLFIDYGFSSKSVPETDPPSTRDYGQIFDWVIGNRWPIELDEELILDIWLGYVDPWNYKKVDNSNRVENANQPKPVEKEIKKAPTKKPKFDTKNLDLLGGMKF